MHKKIIIDVTYDDATVEDDDLLEQALERSVEMAVGDGLLSPGGEFIVDTWEMQILDENGN